MSRIESETSVDETPPKHQAKQELAEELLAAYVRGEIAAADLQAIMSQSATTGSDQGKSNYRHKLRAILGADDPIVPAFDAVVERSRCKKIGDASKAHWLDNAQPIAPEWADKIGAGQRRSYESGKRKPLPADHGARISHGKKKG